MPRYTHIIWDWNGTLFDDTWLCLEIMNQQLQRIGKPVVSYERYQELFDFPVIEFYAKMGFDFSQEPYETIAQHFIDHYAEKRFSCALHCGVEQMLEKFVSYGCKHSLLSAYADIELKKMISFHGIDTHFSHVIGLDNHYASGKVNEGRMLLEKIQQAPDTVVLIGDTTHDYDVAREIGVQSILIDHGHQSRKKLTQCDAAVVSSFAEAMIHVIG